MLNSLHRSRTNGAEEFESINFTPLLLSSLQTSKSSTCFSSVKLSLAYAVKFAVVDRGTYGGSKYTKSSAVISVRIAENGAHEIFAVLRSLLHALKLLASQRFGFSYRPNGTLKNPFEFTRCSPLKQVLFR